MFVATKLIETNAGVFKKGQEVPAEVAVKYSRYVEEVGAPEVKKAPKVEEIKEELLVESPVEVEVETEDSEV